MADTRDGNSLKSFQQKLYIPGSKKRKQYGLLERPSLPPSVPQVSFKLQICGQSGSGKSYFIHRLAVKDGGNRFSETLGIEVTHVYWPMKVGNRLMLFRLELWDAGELSTKKYNHIKNSKQACSEAVDGVLVCFSLTSKDQWSELPQLVSNAAQPSEKPAVMVVATRLDRPSEVAVSEAEIRSFEASRDVPVLRLPPPASHNGDDTANVAPLVNFICRQLWQRDQTLLAVAKDKG